MYKLAIVILLILLFQKVLFAQIVAPATLSNGWHKVQIQPGVYYDGEIFEGRIEGKGIMIWADSSSYSGMWKTNMRHGKGTMKWKNGDTYMGKFKNDEMTKGTYLFANGDKYYGNYEEDKFHGKGNIIRKDGTVEKGVWEYGKKIE
ncbi:MAG: hypothetical protein K0B10_10010 [Vicingaceae bacterium]|nr:hypothetical protein [Vicingaceae bacterium]